jgi:hypothetical protein
MFDFFNRRWRSTPRHPVRQVPGDSEDQNLIRLLVVTRDDNFFLSVHEVATGCGWEARMVRTVERGLQILDEFRASVAIYDRAATEDNWRLDVERLTAGPDHPCVLLASPVDDEYLRAELVRHGGFDVIPRSADADRLVRNIQFAYFFRISKVRGGRSFVR